VHEKLGDSVIGRHDDGRSRLAGERDRGRVGSVGEAKTGNSTDFADCR
jgi:hypothetical protein